ncbi:MAG: chromosomal replication initiator protein DnaA [Candidatus Omnitrophica bacterium]|nr:chromosomal replication initiator protein DnaA [Candidatus Omnitrophota bacterium]MBU1047518.1 chromosomal replication initiator protein DnaA [Candidatus Omnitrophota bacterium]MBU1631160.1 chromosomal replication initiator protein DnaA [Candidatus Omnitrophota bacterium]MBU1767487.1 chromosomal replication initiator protein DnaA [Candidatus Omnitrophota bacterium]MBU1888881.1 chromosomal replication initiator protein DnaA [Candidatus Omnitrophota bacterium]
MSLSKEISVWDRALLAIKDQVDEKSFNMWFKPLKFISSDKNILNIEAPSQLFADWINKNYKEIIDKGLSSITDQKIKIDFSIRREVKGSQKIKKQGPSLFDRPNAGFSPRLNPNYTFDKFVVGGGNQFAHAAAIAVAHSPGKAYNPFFIYGGVGLGKTHLMQAIGNELTLKLGDKNVQYISSEKFTNQLINAIQNRTTEKFRKNYRSLSVLLIDDIHFIAGKESTEAEFFHTFNELYDAHKQIVVSSDRPPQEIPTLEKRLMSRFRWGLVADIQPADFETRMAILQKKALFYGYNVPEDVLSYICSGITANIRELEGALIRVVAYFSLNGKSLNLEVVKELLKDLITVNDTKKTITIDLIKEEVSKVFNIKVSEMNSKKRDRLIVYPRQVAMYLVRELTDFSLPGIGYNFGGRDHTTVMHACNVIKTRKKADKNLDQMINQIIQNLKC